ncbi:hypothetical protein SAMN04488601_1011764 [Paenibacillus sp. 453mf]|nr:hypothetical protein SAMN04488601_1011764 [Paenibacillus sp. 453mf]
MIFHTLNAMKALTFYIRKRYLNLFPNTFPHYFK